MNGWTFDEALGPQNVHFFPAESAAEYIHVLSAY
jgi:hypothetical protein